MISSLSWSWSPWSSSSFNIVCCICFRIVSTKLEYNKHLFQDAVDFDNAETRIKWPFHRSKLPFSSSKLPFHRSKLLLANFHIFEQRYFFSNHTRSYVIIFQFFRYVCPWRANVIYWRQKMYWNPISISPFRPNYVILEMYLPLLLTKVFVQTPLQLLTKNLFKNCSYKMSRKGRIYPCKTLTVNF